MTKVRCPICNQDNMEFHAVTYRSHPYIDGVKYPRMCFGCAHVPREHVQRCNDAGEVVEEIGPFFDHKHLITAKELVEQGSVESIGEAQKCIAGVRTRLKQVGAVKLKKLKLHRPKQEYDNLKDDEPAPAPKKRRKRATKRVTTEKVTTGSGPKKKVAKKAPKKKTKFGAKKVKRS